MVEVLVFVVWVFVVEIMLVFVIVFLPIQVSPISVVVILLVVLELAPHPMTLVRLYVLVEVLCVLIVLNTRRRGVHCCVFFFVFFFVRHGCGLICLLSISLTKEHIERINLPRLGVKYISNFFHMGSGEHGYYKRPK